MSEEMLKALILCAVAVVILAGIAVLTLLIVRSVRKSSQTRAAVHRESGEVDAQPFSVLQEITYIHSQDRLDPQDV